MSVYAFNPCVQCGACCACFRVSFYWTEASVDTGGTVPADLTEQISPSRVMMKGTGGKDPRCVCLQGTIGEQVQCTIYAKRSSVCREFSFSWENAVQNPRCDNARARWGLPPLSNPSQIMGMIE